VTVSEDAPVAFEGVWKKFRRGERHDSLRDLLPSLARRFFTRPGTDLRADEFWALQDVSFHVKRGEALAIIGPNGAGKSTILKTLTKIVKPTRGRCALRGRVGALIEVAAGFHQDLTGRENTFLQGAIMGMPQAEIARKFDDIVEFAGVRDFVDTPVKRYSSGMQARLGFAVAAHLDPDVLIVDEVLAVGDTGFQDRCIERMRQMLARGMPLVFVSHNLEAVLALCTRAVVIDRGRVQFDGDPKSAVQEYRRVLFARGKSEDAGRPRGGDVRIAGVEILDSSGAPASWFRTGDPMTVRIHYEASRPIERPHFAVEIWRADGVECYGVNTSMDRRDQGTLEGRGAIDFEIPRLWLLPAYYAVSVGILHSDCLGAHDVHHRAYPFSVASDRTDHGLVFLEHEWRIQTTSEVKKP
jgi:ABC-type polysaccharide/polyol phosphate transport system ATPase subunit